VPPTPEALAATLAALPLRVDDAACVAADVPVAGYPGGPRPHATVTLHGAGHAGRGEHVAFDHAAHAALRAHAGRLAGLRGTVADVGRRLADRPAWERAACEAAALDLALRQGGTNLWRVAGVVPGPFHCVVSFGGVDDPAATARALGDVALKVDADPAWSEATWAALRDAGRVAVLDWKGGGTRAAHEAAHRRFPDALVEDPAVAASPWSAGLAARLAVDQALTAPDDLDRLPVAPVAANLKPARLGGVLPLLATAGRCAARGVAVYVGGMWEVGVGRRQLHVLAALLAPDGPNDVAPLAERLPPGGRLTVDADAPGLG
jgi:hypothetical protein